ncbi:MAG: exonuclease domain-containing protein, partial [Candidatus Puniceispirillaceae bacterium]
MMLATTPLSQLPLVSLDLETTGLTPARDRIVQIGAITIESPAQHFDMLVNP